MRSPRNDRAAGHMFQLCGLAYLGVALATRQTVFITLGPALIVPASAAMLLVFPAICLGYGVVKVFISRRYG